MDHLNPEFIIIICGKLHYKTVAEPDQMFLVAMKYAEK